MIKYVTTNSYKASKLLTRDSWHHGRRRNYELSRTHSYKKINLSFFGYCGLVGSVLAY